MLKKIAAILTVCCIAACSQKADVVTSKGREIHLDALHGKWLVVNYWADWCHNCKQDMRDFSQFYQHHKNKVLVLGVNFDGMENDKLNRLQQQWHISFPVTAHFPIERFGIEHIDNIPRTYIISPDGKLQKTLLGPQTEQSLAKAVNMT